MTPSSSSTRQIIFGILICLRTTKRSSQITGKNMKQYSPFVRKLHGLPWMKAKSFAGLRHFATRLRKLSRLHSSQGKMRNWKAGAECFKMQKSCRMPWKAPCRLCMAMNRRMVPRRFCPQRNASCPVWPDWMTPFHLSVKKSVIWSMRFRTQRKNCAHCGMA